MASLKILFPVFMVSLLCAQVGAQSSSSGKNNYNSMILSIKASSELFEDNERIYPAVNLIDGTERSWAPERDDANPSIELRIDDDCGPFGGIDHLYIKNGFGQEKFFKKNNRVKEIKIELFVGPENSKPSLEIETQLKDTPEIQAIPLPYKCMPRTIRISILSVYPGSAYQDTCLSEISISPIVVEQYSYRPQVTTFSFTDEYFNLTLYDDFHYECNGETDFAALFAHGSMLGVSLIKGEWGYTSGGYLFINGYYHFGWSDPEGNSGTDENKWRTIVFSPNWDTYLLKEYD